MATAATAAAWTGLWPAPLPTWAGVDVAVTPTHLFFWPHHAPAAAAAAADGAAPATPTAAANGSQDAPKPPVQRRPSSVAALVASPPRPVLALRRQRGAAAAIELRDPATAAIPADEWPPADHHYAVYGIVGIYSLRANDYVVLAIGARAVGEIHQRPVFRLTRVACVPLEGDGAAAVLDALGRRVNHNGEPAAPRARGRTGASVSRWAARTETALASSKAALARTWESAAHRLRSASGGGVSGGQSGVSGGSSSAAALPPGGAASLRAADAASAATGSGAGSAESLRGRPQDDDARTLRAMHQYFEAGDFYFSYYHDLTNCLQRQPVSGQPVPELLGPLKAPQHGAGAGMDADGRCANVGLAPEQSNAWTGASGGTRLRSSRWRSGQNCSRGCCRSCRATCTSPYARGLWRPTGDAAPLADNATGRRPGRATRARRLCPMPRARSTTCSSRAAAASARASATSAAASTRTVRWPTLPRPSRSADGRPTRGGAGRGGEPQRIDPDGLAVPAGAHCRAMQIIARSGSYTSYVITRGSIPLFWSQPPTSLRPTPVLERSEAENADAMRRHFQEQLRTTAAPDRTAVHARLARY